MYEIKRRIRESQEASEIESMLKLLSDVSCGGKSPMSSKERLLNIAEKSEIYVGEADLEKVRVHYNSPDLYGIMRVNAKCKELYGKSTIIIIPIGLRPGEKTVLLAKLLSKYILEFDEKKESTYVGVVYENGSLSEEVLNLYRELIMPRSLFKRLEYKLEMQEEGVKYKVVERLSEILECPAEEVYERQESLEES